MVSGLSDSVWLLSMLYPIKRWSLPCQLSLAPSRHTGHCHLVPGQHQTDFYF